jgi:hypothetical protein
MIAGPSTCPRASMFAISSSSRARMPSRKLRPIAATQHTLIDVYAYGARRKSMLAKA